MASSLDNSSGFIIEFQWGIHNWITVMASSLDNSSGFIIEFQWKLHD